MGAHELGVSTVQMTGSNQKIERMLMNKAIAYSSNVAMVEKGIMNMSDDTTYAQFQVDMDKFIVKLIQAASKEDLFERVIDLANRLQTPKCFDFAIKVCRNRRQDTLVEKIYNIQQQRINEKYNQQQKSLRAASTMEEEQQPYQPQTQQYTEVSFEDTSSDNNIKPVPAVDDMRKTTKSSVSSSSDSPPLMQNKFQLAAEKRTVKSNKRTITGKNKGSFSKSRHEPFAKKQKQGAYNPFAKGPRSPEKSKQDGVFSILQNMKSPGAYSGSSAKSFGILGRKSTMSKEARENYSKNKNVM